MILPLKYDCCIKALCRKTFLTKIIKEAPRGRGNSRLHARKNSQRRKTFSRIHANSNAFFGFSLAHIAPQQTFHFHDLMISGSMSSFSFPMYQHAVISVQIRLALGVSELQVSKRLKNTPWNTIVHPKCPRLKDFFEPPISEYLHHG